MVSIGYDSMKLSQNTGLVFSETSKNYWKSVEKAYDIKDSQNKEQIPDIQCVQHKRGGKQIKRCKEYNKSCYENIFARMFPEKTVKRNSECKTNTPQNQGDGN